MLIIFDKGLLTERSIEMDNFFEHPINNNVNLVKEITIKEGINIPDYSALSENFIFSTVTLISSNNVELPLIGKYNKVTSIGVNYFDADKRYTININLGKQGENEEV